MLCALALVLVMDVSDSIPRDDYERMREGHAAALEASAVVDRVAEGARIAVAVVQFASTASIRIEWQLLATPAGVNTFAGRVRGLDRIHLGLGTETAGGIDLALQLLQAPPCDPERQVIDVVSDGVDSAPITAAARDRAWAAGVRINALMVGRHDGKEAWAREHLVTPGGFVLMASDWEDFLPVVRRKLAAEAAGTEPGTLFAGE